MPFQSEKQRRYLWANEPEIARDWSKKYGSRVRKYKGGDITNFNPSKIALGNKNYNTLQDLEAQYAEQYPEMNTSGGVFSDARHAAATSLMSDRLGGGWIGDTVANIGGGIRELPTLTSELLGLTPRGESWEDIKANAQAFNYPSNTSAADIYADVFSKYNTNKGIPATNVGFKYGAAQAGEPDKNNFSQEFADLHKQGVYDNLSLAMDDAKKYAKGEITSHEELTGYNPITDIYDRDYTAGEHYNMTPDAKIKAMRQDLKSVPEHIRRQTNFPTASHMRRQTNFPTSTAQQFANLGQPHKGFEQSGADLDKWGNRRMAQEKRDPARPQRKGLGSGITSAWSALKGSPLGSVVAQAFKGPQLTPQQKQMNTNFMKQHGVTRAPPTMGGRMVGGPFAGMNAPGTSAFGSKTSQEMAQKWMDKYGDMKYTTPKMQQKQQTIKNIATMNQGPAGINIGSGDKGQHTTQGKSTSGYQPGGHHLNRGGIAGLWPR